MRKISAVMFAFVFILALTGLCFAANDFQIKGTVTGIDGNRITIRDNQGKETSLEVNTNGIKKGDKVLAHVTIRVYEDARKLTEEEKKFMAGQCLIDSADINIVPELDNDRQVLIVKGAADRDCKKLAAFKASREYYRKLAYDKSVPLAPAGWNILYLTKEEFKRYADIFEKAPW